MYLNNITQTSFKQPRSRGIQDKRTDFRSDYKKSGRRMIEERLPSLFGEDLPQVLTFFPDIRLLMVNQTYYLSPLSGSTAALSEKYGIDWWNPLWQR